MKPGIVLIFMLLSLIAKGQTTHVTLSLLPVFDTAALATDVSYHLKNGDSIQIEELRFYISGIALYSNGRQVWQEPNSFHLVDIATPESLYFPLKFENSIRFDRIKFSLGIDSVTNVSGVMDGDLDPVKGMYWTWQSGYINVKLEGQSPVCPTRNHKFRFHLGGYAGSTKSVQQISLPVLQRDKIEIRLAVDSFLSSIDLSRENEIMIPGKDAVVLSQKLAGTFQAAAP